MTPKFEKLATSVLTAIGALLAAALERKTANMAIFCASLLVVFANAKIDLYFYNKIMTGSPLELQVAQIYVRAVIILYAGMITMSWSLLFYGGTFVKLFLQPPDTFMQWVIAHMNDTIADTSYVLHVVAGLSTIFRILVPLLQGASRRARMVVLGIFMAMLCVNVCTIHTDQRWVYDVLVVFVEIVELALQVWGVHPILW